MESPMKKQREAWTVIAVGVILLLVFGLGLEFDHWWALFILVPGLYQALQAYQEYQRTGFSPVVGAKVASSLPLLLVGSIFVLDLDWGRVWPLFIIMGGVIALLNPYKLKKDEDFSEHKYERVEQK